jgi:SAM-dependent methyltransferase
VGRALSGPGPPRRAADYVEANRRAWNEVAPIHRRHNFAELRRRFARPGYSCLDEVMTALLRRASVVGRDVAQLGCNNGRELISMRSLGAARCVGFDIAEAFIAEARELNAAAGLDVEFVCCGAHDVPAAHDGAFDVVVVTIGVLGWMPDLARFMAVAARLLRPGGRLVVYEMHPVLWMFEGEECRERFVVRHPYFDAKPFVEHGLDYYGRTAYDARPNYSFQHTLGEILTCCLEVGLALAAFEEHGHDISMSFAAGARLRARPPMCYTLLAVKRG